eukprot:g3533.t1
MQKTVIPCRVGTPEISARRASGTRVRRLSVVTADQAKDVLANDAAISVDCVVGGETNDSPAKAAASTRNRRLSVLTTQEMKKKLEEEKTRAGGAVEESVEIKRVVSRSQSSRSNMYFETEVACVSRTGREPGAKKTNQDNCFAFEKFIRRGDALFAAFDGHGSEGHSVSSFVKHHLPLVLTRQLSKLGRHRNDEQITQVLSSVFLEVQESLMHSPIDIEFSGTTATVGYLTGRKLFVAWVGDSRCVLAIHSPQGKVTAKDLTMDHKPDTESERNDTGAEIGPWRVWAKYAWIPGLAMSRALGDECAHQMGVISEPDVTITEVHPEAIFAIFASDGVWEFVSSQEAVEIVHNSTDPNAGCRKVKQKFIISTS